MEVVQLQKRLFDMRSSLFQDGFLDEQFYQLQQLQDESNPDFVSEVLQLFFQDSQKLLDELGRVLHQQHVDFKIVDAYIHQLKGSSSSIGASRIKNICQAFRRFCDECNMEGCRKCLQQVNYELLVIKGKLEKLLELEKHILAAGGSVPFPGYY